MIGISSRVRSDLVPGSFQKSFVFGGTVNLLSLVFESTNASLIVISLEGYKIISFRMHKKFDWSVTGLKHSTCEHVTETLDLNDP